MQTDDDQWKLFADILLEKVMQLGIWQNLQGLNESLHYKSKRAMSFEIFLTQCQKMFNIYKKEEEEMSDEAKVRFLFRKVQHTGPRSYIDALKASQKTGMAISYTMDAKYLSTATSELPEYICK